MISKRERRDVEARIRDNCGKLISECNQILRDVSHWNEIHPNEQPITPDDSLMEAIEMKQYAEGVLRMLDECGTAEGPPPGSFFPEAKP